MAFPSRQLGSRLHLSRDVPGGPDDDAIALRAVFVLAAGPALVREWTWRQVRDGSSPDWVHSDPPAWLCNPEMSWHDRRGPIEVRANVPRTMEDEARALLGL